jgi:hypothetical protein
MMKGDRAMLKAIAICSVALALFAASCGGSTTREANEEILNSLSQLPGSKLVSVDTQPYRDCRLLLPRTIGHITTAKYRAPEDIADDEIVAFYIEQLSTDWKFTKGSFDVELLAVRQPPSPGSIQIAHFQRGTAAVFVQTGIPFPGDSAEEPAYDFSVTIDSRGIPGRPDC